MSVGARRAALAAVLGACLAGGPTALAADGPLVAQIAQVAQTQPGDEPALSGKPPTKLSGDSGKPKPAKSGSGHSPDTTPDEAEPAKALASTGADAAMVALAGFGLLGWGPAPRPRGRGAPGAPGPPRSPEPGRPRRT